MSRESRLTAVPAKRSSAPILQIRLFIVLGTLVIAAIAGLVSFFAWMSLSIPEPDLTKALPEGKSLSEIAARDWLDGRESTLPAIEGLSLPKSDNPLPYSSLVWDSFTKGSLPSGFPFELHSFTVQLVEGTDRDGKNIVKSMLMVVPVSFNSDGDPLLAGLPYLEQISTKEAEIIFDYSDVGSAPLPTGATTQISKWAQSWADDSREQLKLLTGDTAPGIEYKGLGGFVADRVQIINALPAGNTIYGSDTFLVRVRVFISSNSANKFSTATDLDLTVTDASSGLPKIVGWGSAAKGLLGPQETRVIVE